MGVGYFFCASTFHARSHSALLARQAHHFPHAQRGRLRLRKEMELAQGQVSSERSLGCLPLCTALALVQGSGLAGWGQVPGRAVGHCKPPGGERCRAWAPGGCRAQEEGREEECPSCSLQPDREDKTEHLAI